MTPAISRGFRGRRREESEARRVPPGQYVTHDFPVLSARPTPYVPIDWWSFEIRGRSTSRGPYICRPTGFVEAIADALVTLGHSPDRIRTERFGPT
jgi:hypothetical protein